MVEKQGFTINSDAGHVVPQADRGTATAGVHDPRVSSARSQ